MALRISQVAERGGVNLQTIRFYERAGLLPAPPRLQSGYRVFSESAVRRVRFIKRAQELGFSLAEIRELLSLRFDVDRNSSEVRAMAEAKIADVDAKIRTLQAMKDILSRVTEQCSGCGPISECPILESIVGGGLAMTWRRAAAVIPGVGVSLLPKLTCPMCWPAYAALLSTLGLSFLISARYLLTVVIFCLVLSVASLAFRARKRHGYGPALIGLVAALLVVWGKFSLESNSTVYAGIGALIAASVWNVWPRRAPTARFCDIHSPAEAGINPRNVQGKKRSETQN